MADRSFKWAAEKGSGFFRKHPVHGEEEAKLVLTDAFNVNEQDGNEMTCESSFNVEDSGDNLLNQVEGVDVEDEVPPETPPATAAGSFKFHPHLFWKMWYPSSCSLLSYSHPAIPDPSCHHAQVVVSSHLRDGCDDVPAATLRRDSGQKDWYGRAGKGPLMQLWTFIRSTMRLWNSWCSCWSKHSRTKLIRIAVIGLRGFSAAEMFHVPYLLNSSHYTCILAQCLPKLAWLC